MGNAHGGSGVRTFDEVFDERMIQEKRLTDLGFVVDGGGTDMTTMRWDIFAYGPGEVYVTILQSVADVDDFIQRYRVRVS